MIQSMIFCASASLLTAFFLITVSECWPFPEQSRALQRERFAFPRGLPHCWMTSKVWCCVPLLLGGVALSFFAGWAVSPLPSLLVVLLSSASFGLDEAAVPFFNLLEV